MKFSIIIPVYNVKLYIKRCITSVLNQTYKDYEVILVDDGSTDGSGKICDEYVKQDNRIRVIHQKNHGVSVARNVGIQAAIVEILLFLDSDDCYEQNNFLKEIAKVIHGADIVVFNWKEFKHGQKFENCTVREYLSHMKREYIDGVSFLQDVVSMSLYPWYIWFYAFRKDFWMEHGFQFPIGMKYEDVALTYKVLLKAKKIITVENIWYCYMIGRSGSITSTLNYETEIDKLNIISENILDIQTQNVPNELKIKLCNNFSCLYYSAVIQSYRIRPKENRKYFWKILQGKSWVCQYTTEKRQKFVRNIINLFGIPTTSALLNLRRIIKRL